MDDPEQLLLQAEDRAITEPRCGLTESACRCGREADHDGEHVCDLDRCNGAWTYDAEGRFRALRLPGDGDELFSAIFWPQR